MISDPFLTPGLNGKQTDNDIAARMEVLGQLHDGWLDGSGIALTSNHLSWLKEAFARFYPDDLPSPYLYPTIKGGIRAEWTVPPYDVSLEIDLRAKVGRWHSLNLVDDAEETAELNLTDTNHWQLLIQHLREAQRANA